MAPTHTIQPVVRASQATIVRTSWRATVEYQIFKRECLLSLIKERKFKQGLKVFSRMWWAISMFASRNKIGPQGKKGNWCFEEGSRIPRDFSRRETGPRENWGAGGVIRSSGQRASWEESWPESRGGNQDLEPRARQKEGESTSEIKRTSKSGTL